MNCFDLANTSLIEFKVAAVAFSRSRMGGAGVRRRMQISSLLDGRASLVHELRMGRLVRKALGFGLGSLLLAFWPGGAAMAQSGQLVLQRDGRVISLVPYAPNIVRVTISTAAAA